MATEDLCLVCTNSLDYAGVGPCGHKDVCSRCVARLRFVMEDSRCSLCKADQPAVFFTRYMGDYTHTLAPDQFARLQERAASRELWALPEVNGYFDDQDHYKLIKGLCSFTHPLAAGASFNTLASLKRRLLDTHKLHFCDLCIKGRKVFISEQVLYSKADLERHHRQGDDAGPLAESGFKGHPQCRFCRKRFYDGDELYRHMESAHEHCFLCRKARPNAFVYYRDYDELDGHFQAQHHPCPHPACLERKFVVFAEEQDLKRHFATEHAGDTNMSRAQRRQALAVNIQLTYSSRQEQEDAAAAAAALARPGVVIGGGHNLPRRGGRGGGSSSMRHSASEGAMAQALQASMDSEAARAAAAAGPSSVTFSAEDFPSVSGQGGSGTAPLGTWLGASGGPGGAGPSLNQEEFPSLPTLSRGQRRRARERSANSSLAARLAASSAPIRVVNRAAAGPTPAQAAAAAAAGVRHSQSASNLAAAAAGGGSAAASVAASESDADGACDDSDFDTAPAASSSSAADAFPALPGAAATQAHPAWVPVRRSGKPPRPGQAGGSSAAASRAAAPNSIADFPSLAATMPAGGRSAAAASSGSSNKGRQGAAASSSKGAGGGSSSRPAAATVAEAVAAAGGVSAELKAANKALIERCRAALSDSAFADFRERSAAFMQGSLGSEAYHKHVVQLGLLQLVPELAALCPDAGKRTALLAAHKAYLQDSHSSLAAPPASMRGWVPPEAALAALAVAEAQGSWACERCTLTNAPSSRACEVCCAPRPKAVAAAAGSSSGASTWTAAAAASSSSSGSSSSQAAQPGQQQPKQQASPQRPAPPPAAAESWPTLAGRGGGASSSSAPPQPEQAGSSAAAGSSSSSAGGKKARKPAKQPLAELLASGQSHPQNAWSQQQRKGAVTAPQAPAPKGAWKAQGGAKLAKTINNIDEAWGKRQK